MAYLVHARLHGANLSGAAITREQFEQAEVDGSTDDLIVTVSETLIGRV